MTRNQLMWTLVVFFGCSLMFGALRKATDGESAVVVAGVQIGALAVVLVVLAIAVKRLRK